MPNAMVRAVAEILPWRLSRPVVSVVRLTGVIAPSGRLGDGLNMRTVAPALERAFRGRNVKAVALLINSPGGSAAQSMSIYRRIRALAAEKELPVLAFAEDAAASGGYLLACAADEIFANESSIVGSIGVIAATFGFQDLISRLGIERRVYTAGEQKGLLDPFRPIDPHDVARLKEVQADIHDAFKGIVRESRGARLKGSETELFSGAFWTGRQGLALGLIDGLADVRSELRGKFGRTVRMRVIEPERRRSFWRFGLSTGHGGASRGILSPLSLPRAVNVAIAAFEDRVWWSRLGL